MSDFVCYNLITFNSVQRDISRSAWVNWEFEGDYYRLNDSLKRKIDIFSISICIIMIFLAIMS